MQDTPLPEAFRRHPEQILNDPSLNKGTAFTREERDLLRLNGFLPYHVSTLEEQVERRYQNFKSQSSALAKHLFLSALHNRNEILFYKLISQYITEMLPYVYTPTVGEFSLQYSLLYTESKGLYLSYPEKDNLESIIQNFPKNRVDIAVVTDGGRTLGLGDLGTGGMAISVGKLTLYSVFSGACPSYTLPIMLDLGTNNADLLNDPLYLGWRHPRVQGNEYADFIDRFVRALKKKYPSVLLQWEDFSREHAHTLLEKYRHQICSFNDDIQGTASVVLAALLAASHKQGSSLQEQRIVVLGGGSAGIGISKHLLGHMLAEGVMEKRALQSLYIVDIQGLVTDYLDTVPQHQQLFSRKRSEVDKWGVKNHKEITLLEVIRQVKPTVLIGVSAQEGAFTQDIITNMAKYVDHPIIFPLSNPTSKSEAHPKDLLHWTQGRAIIATGSPFEGISYQGRDITIPQCNNVYIYPGIGLGVVACKAREVSENMFYAAAKALARHSPLLKDPHAPLFPPFDQLKNISKGIAIEVIKIAEEEGMTHQLDEEKRKALIDKIYWNPRYSSSLSSTP